MPRETLPTSEDRTRRAIDHAVADDPQSPEGLEAGMIMQYPAFAGASPQVSASALITWR
ncbi:hypothetical protein [Micromonospora sp. NPDC049497]|uniref:hypothetical protein n=1 Tax=Micromonospora sp. NPDC049497 TaxID=3364273 RepID=UPI00379BAD1D